jgi:hypothetical protein
MVLLRFYKEFSAMLIICTYFLCGDERKISLPKDFSKYSNEIPKRP